MVRSPARGALLLLLACASARAGEDITPSALPAVRGDGRTIVLDGELSEAAWERATRVTGLTRAEPIEGGPPVGRAEFRIFYDDEALYIGARVEQPPGLLRAHVSPRDDLGNDDSINIYLQPILGSDTLYLFRVNPLGIQRDILVSSLETLFPMWDTTWESAGKPSADGYTVEVRLPFRALRFIRGNPQRWGLSVGVRTGALGQLDLWPPYSSDRGRQFTQLGTLEGMTDLKTGAGLELLPSLTLKYRGSAAPPTLVQLRQPGLLDPGLDVRYGLTRGLTASATFNPDFSQVEADPEQLNYDLRYPLQLQEKRPFFIEGLQAFETPVPLLYTRGINDPLAGLKLSGAEGKASLGFLSILDQDPPPTRLRFDPAVGAPPSSGFENTEQVDALTTVGRALLEVSPAARLGLFAADKRAFGRQGEGLVAQHSLLALDAWLNFERVYFITAQGGYSRTGPAGGPALDGGFSLVNVKRVDRSLLVEAETAYYGPGFRAETSVLSRTGYVPSHVTAAYKLDLDSRYVLSVRPEVTTALVLDAASFDRLDWVVKPAVALQLAGSSTASLRYFHGEESFNGRRFPVRAGELQFASAPLPWLDATVQLAGGNRINYEALDTFLGSALDASLALKLKPSQLLVVEARYTKSVFERPERGGTAANVDLAYLRVLYNLDSRWAVQALSQWNSYRESFEASLLLSYVHGPGSAIYLGYQHAEPLSPRSLAVAQRYAFLKLAYHAWL